MTTVHTYLIIWGPPSFRRDESFDNHVCKYKYLSIQAIEHQAFGEVEPTPVPHTVKFGSQVPQLQWYARVYGSYLVLSEYVSMSDFTAIQGHDFGLTDSVWAMTKELISIIHTPMSSVS